MTKQLWINLPVKDAKKSVAFFTAIGFQHDPSPHAPAGMEGLLIGENKVMVMLCEEALFNSFTSFGIADTSASLEVLFSFDAESREEVDELAKKVTAAGGKPFGEPQESNGFMYGFGFSDLDGHKWNVLYMDMSKLG
jgi:uncharacterized protein